MNIINVIKKPSFIPQHIFNEIVHSEQSYKVSKPEKRIFKKGKKELCSVWAEKHRKITKGPMKGNLWSNEITPYLTDVMDASFYPFVRTIILCFPPQFGKSASLQTCIGYTQDCFPGDALILYPDEKTTKENITDKIIPMFQESKRLNGLLSTDRDNVTKEGIRLKTTNIYTGWAGSATSIADKSCRYVFMDEIDKYPITPNKKEAGVIANAEKRTNSFPDNHKIWKSSTVTIESGNIWQALTVEAQVIFEYIVRCPFCYEYELMVFKNIKWPRLENGDHPNPEDVMSEKLAFYECSHCNARWNDYDRNLAVKYGYWKVKNGIDTLKEYLKKKKPGKIGFHAPSWISYFVSISAAASAFIKGLSDSIAMRDFSNNHACEPWLDAKVNREVQEILNLKDDRPLGVVPGGNRVAALVCGADTQDNGWFYEIRAIGWGLVQETWQINYGFVDSLEALFQVVFGYKYRDVEGNFYPVHLMVIDAMGHRTDEVYNFARSYPTRVLCYKGTGRKASPISYSNIDTYPGSGKLIEGGIKLAVCDTHYFKDLLVSKIKVKPGDPGAWNMSNETSKEFAQHLCAEYVDDKNLWQCKKNVPNHYWDCSVLNYIAANILQVRFWTKTGE